MILQPILDRKKRAQRKKKSLFQALSEPQLSIIAEIKRASPSKGKIADIPDPAHRAQLYVQGGASAISVLTDEAFEGSMDDLKRVSAALAHTSIPVLQKDFILHPAQLIEAEAAGADAVLLIVAILQESTAFLLELAIRLGLEAIVEVHTKEELDLALQCKARIIGVNQRDLRDFSMHPERFSELIGMIPEDCIAIAESGLSSAMTGYDAMLVGEALSRSQEPLETLSRLRCL